MSEPDRKRGLPQQLKMRHGSHFVDELAARDVRPIGRMLPLEVIEPDPEQPRSSTGDLSDLAASIQDKGVLEPILVRPLPRSPAASQETDASVPLYRIISGERRYRAAIAAGLHEIPCIELDVGEREALEIALIENLQRKDLTPFEEGDGYQALKSRFGYTHERIADVVGRSRTVVTESLALLQMPAAARAAAEALGVESKTALREVLKASSPEAMVALLEEISRLGLSRDDLREQRRSRPQRTGARGVSGRRQPYVFKFRSPDRSFNLALSFRKSEVERTDLIAALESILGELRAAEDPHPELLDTALDRGRVADSRQPNVL